MDLDDGGRLAGIEAAGAARHGAGVPVIELAAGIHDERILVVRQLDGIGVLDRHERGAAVRRRERLVEEERGARMVLGRNGILQPGAFEPLVGDARPAGSDSRDLAHHVFGAAERRRQPQPVAEVHQDLEIAAGLAGGVDRLVTQLNASLGVDERTGLFGEAGPG